MERNEIVLSQGFGGDGDGDGFIDRSKVRILLCDKDAKSSDQVFTLLCKCSYQVTSVRSPRQVLDALNAEGPDFDIILSEVDLPMSKGMKMLKHITRDKELRRIPVIMMSTKDEVSVVVKCLRLGAADYLVKPLRTNELLNLWTHMWRRRRRLGPEEKNILNYDFYLVASDPSDANTNSTTLFSDDTDDKSGKSANPETCVSLSTHQQDEATAATADDQVETPLMNLYEYEPDVPGRIHWQGGHILSCPKKSELKIGESSAFFTYVKSNILKNHSQGVVPVDDNAPERVTIENKRSMWGGQVDCDTKGNANEEAKELSRQSNSKIEGFPQEYTYHRNESQHDVLLGFNPHTAYAYYISAASNIMPQYNHIPHCHPHMPPGMPSFPYYPIRVCSPPGQMPKEPTWPSYGASSSSDKKLNKVDRREAALLKFRQKRKERCFDKKIRYVNQKRLAEKRPRVRGQFMRKMNGLNVDLNGQPASAYYDDDDDDEEDDDADDDRATWDSSPRDDASVFR